MATHDDPSARAPDCHRPFFALLPPPEAQAAIAAVRDALPEARSPLRDDRLHMTLLMIDDVPVLPPGLADALRSVGDRVAAPAFEVTLDRLVGGRGHALLVPADGQPALRAFQAALAEALVAEGLPIRRGWRFSPHVTLAYGAGAAIDRTVAPIRWRVRECVLIDSWVGLTRHERLGCWPLGEGRRAAS